MKTVLPTYTLTINGLQAGYKREAPVLKDINLSIPQGSVHGLVGLNGAGKTTLLNTLYGFITPFSGDILFGEHPLRRKDIAYLDAENYFYPYMTGREYLSLFPEGYGVFQTDSWQMLFNLPLDDITENYSSGMKKKLALLATLKPNKPVLILDEPFNGLDLESCHLLTMIIQQLGRNDKAVIVTSHIYESLTDCCNEIHYLSDGYIKQTYPKESFSTLKEELSRTIEHQSGDLINDLMSRD